VKPSERSRATTGCRTVRRGWQVAGPRPRLSLGGSLMLRRWPMSPDAVDREPQHWPWPQSAYASGNQEWIDYLHQGYYLLGLFYAAGAGDKAILALADAAKTVTAKAAAPSPSVTVAKARLKRKVARWLRP